MPAYRHSDSCASDAHARLTTSCVHVQARNKDGLTAMHLAALHNRAAAVHAMCTTVPSAASLLDKKGRTAAQLALDRGYQVRCPGPRAASQAHVSTRHVSHPLCVWAPAVCVGPAVRVAPAMCWHPLCVGTRHVWAPAVCVCVCVHPLCVSTCHAWAPAVCVGTRCVWHPPCMGTCRVCAPAVCEHLPCVGTCRVCGRPLCVGTRPVYGTGHVWAPSVFGPSMRAVQSSLHRQWGAVLGDVLRRLGMSLAASATQAQPAQGMSALACRCRRCAQMCPAALMLLFL